MKANVQYAGLSIVSLAILVIAIGSMGGKDIDRNDADHGTMNAIDTSAGIVQVMKIPALKDRYTFAGTEIPLEIRDVRERLQHELIVNTYYHSSTILNLLRSARYFDEIERILREEGVPLDFKYLAVAESNLTNATSPAGAKGFWQFMPAVARQYGLEVNSAIDERYNLEKATHAACELLKDNYERFGSWILAAAAYNAGATRISKSMEYQNASDYFDLNLNAETARYIFRIVALKDILQDPTYYGFYIQKDQLYKPLSDYYIIRVNETIESLGNFASQHGISYRTLKIYNPWMLTHRLPDESGKLYKIRIPNNPDN